MNYLSLLVLLVGLVSLHAGVYLWLGLPATLITAGVLLVSGGLLIDLENE